MAEVKLMLDPAYKTKLPRPAASVLLSEAASALPAELDQAHERIQSVTALLSEQTTHNAKIEVSNMYDADRTRAQALLEKGTLTIPAYNKLVQLCERKRANVLVHLAEGAPDEAAAHGQDLDNVFEMLDEVPSNVAAEGTPDAMPPDAVGAEPPVDDGMSPDAKLDAMARELMKSQGISYTDAIRQASAALEGGDAGMAPPMPTGGAPAPGPGPGGPVPAPDPTKGGF
jgi:hypothetical protein